jgi:hypothetical protein
MGDYSMMQPINQSTPHNSWKLKLDAGGANKEVEMGKKSVLENTIRQDIEDLHAFFVAWYNGNLPDHAVDDEFVARLSTDFTIIMPSGTELDYDTLSSAMRQSFGKNPGFRIEIRNVGLIHVTESTAVARYEEWQRNQKGGAETGSGRISTVVFSRQSGLKWLHVHETWLPEDVVRADPFDF